MKAITLYEPWASLMAVGAKVNETRGCRTKYRGDICIHAAKTDHGLCSEQVAHAAIRAFKARGFGPMGSFGCIVAVVEIWDVQPSIHFIRGADRAKLPLIVLPDEEAIFGNYEPGRFIYRTRNLRRLAVPVPCRGFQSIGWAVPPEIEELVTAQLQPRCGFGIGTDDPCRQPATHLSTFQGRPGKLAWCTEHHAGLVENPQTPGHDFVKL